MAAKIQIKNDLVKKFGRFYSFTGHCRNDGMADVIDNMLGYRSAFAQCNHPNIFLALVAAFLAGGSCIENANRDSRIFAKISQGCRFSNADTILGMIRAASVRNRKMLLYQFLKSGQILARAYHVFDCDSQFAPKG